MRKYLSLVTFLTLTVLLFGRGNVHAFAKGSEQECIKCHTLSAEDAKETLKALIPDVTILDVRQGPINGVWEIGVESGGQKGILYLDFSKRRLISGNFFDIKTRTNYTQEAFNRINRVDLSSFPLEPAVVMGDRNAPIRVVVFDDPD